VTNSYNHYGLLRTIEDIFGLSHLGFAAQDGLPVFDSKIFSAKWRSAEGDISRFRTVISQICNDLGWSSRPPVVS
jgi:hypothetical protein